MQLQVVVGATRATTASRRSAVAIRLKFVNAILAAQVSAAAAPRGTPPSDVFDTSHRRPSDRPGPRSLQLTHVDHRLRRRGRPQRPGQAACATAGSFVPPVRDWSSVGVPRADRARRVSARVRRVHLRHRHMARFVRVVRSLPPAGEPVAGRQRVRHRAIGLYR